MPDVPVTLVPWFDAKDNPPKDDKIVVADSAYGYYDRGGWWQHYDDYGPDPMDPQPSRWCDPSPPDEDDPLGPLTHVDLEAAHAFLNLYRMDQAERDNDNSRRRVRVLDAVLPRLRRALDAIGTDPK